MRTCDKLPGGPSSLAYSPDGKRLLASQGKVAHLLDAATGRTTRKLVGHTTNIQSARFAPDGKRIVTCAGNYLYDNGKIVVIDNVQQYTDTTVRIWDVPTGNELLTIKRHTRPVYQAFWSFDGKFLYSGGAEGTMVRRELADLNKPEAPVFPGLSPQTYGFRLSPDGTKVLMTHPWQLKLWDLASWKPLWESKFGEPISNATFASDSRHLAVSLSTGVIYLFRLAPPELK